jgi:hypothetical protein
MSQRKYEYVFVKRTPTMMMTYWQQAAALG